MNIRYAVNIGPGKWIGAHWWRTVSFDKAKVYQRKGDAINAVNTFNKHRLVVDKKVAELWTVTVIQGAPC